ncbi:DUF2972 domain-containing protein [Campylobacter jejuni]|nr:DUF2972 domain-containing protein [Campylobacter jejuni]
MYNPNSAIERVKNHLAYKLGQAMIDFTNNGGGYITLFKKLYKIKKQHKKEQKIYQQTIQVFPQLKYPSLETCSDYEQALRYKFHLSYMLGEVLIKADKTWYKGSGFKLKNDIKKAKKEFQIFREIFKEFDRINSSILEGLIDNKQLFLKEFPRIKNILKIHQDYQPILDNIFYNFNYFIQNFDLIEEWLLSDDFKERYKKENHPYPSLLDPKKLNDENEKINYHNIPAELAWDMNLPLPDKYKFVYLGFGLSGHLALDLYLRKCSCYLVYAESGYKNILYTQCEEKAVLCIISLWKKNFAFEHKILSLLNNEITVLVLVRDPIERLKTGVNHGYFAKSNQKFYDVFFINDDIDKTLDRFKYYLGDIVSDLPIIETIDFTIQHSSFYINSLFNKVIKNNVLYIDMDEITPQQSFQTLLRLSKFLDFDQPKFSDMKYFKEIKYNDFKYILPLVLNIYYEGQKIPIYIEATISQSKKIDIFKYIFSKNHELYNKVHFYIDNFYIELIDCNSNFLNYIKEYIIEFLNKLDLKIKKIVANKIKEKDVLVYLKSNQEIRKKLKNILDKELVHIKQHRPDIVASWKYYQEFEKMYKELDGDI